MPTALPSRAPASRGSVLRTQLAGMLRLAAGLPQAWTRWCERHRQREALAELDDRMLDDVGLTRRQAERECRKPPWR